MPISIITADDHPLILKGLNDFLIEKQFNVIASAKNGKDAFTLIKAHEPDIAILDIQMPILTGLQVAEKCNTEKFRTRIIIITFEKSETIYKKAKNLGIYGYILKEFAIAEIENCIASVLKGKSYFSAELIEYLEIKETPKELATLTDAEMKVLKLTAQNKTAKEIAIILFISDRTVEKHKSNIRHKLKLESKANSIVLFAKEHQEFLSKYI
ncbi:DNA-binding response regulator, NarL/FixJ family, contains REC and HTH domains [Formosa sp. Hel1_31_208]|uniref:response regulator transcription factor n=1 Tax=Formosa sp. Hel1_31_208 TaxID=1798225 RepID=UPI00087DD4E5|nr:response regulator transcription factor [Formosa sp. Hel1_31_208]SDR68197.1 DNA-binding response regulator, NarL/FixJ family, contains REC and HTH domains [Formosa sp. Hel1_31_208]